jgi:putative toxin-antitoxin system antitoxin component (TIGR02293 family)
MGKVHQKERLDFWETISRLQTKKQLSVYDIVWSLLGWNNASVKKPSSTIVLYQLINKGIPKSAVNAFSQNLDIPLTSIAPMLNMSYKTLTRKEEAEILDSAVSSQLYEVASVYAKAIEIFQDQDKVTRWFNKENKALRGEHPFALLNTITGIRLVSDVLGRIQEGVYS